MNVRLGEFMSKRKNKKRTIDAMSAALFFFAASVMMFVGVTGVMHIGTSYAIGESTGSGVPDKITLASKPIDPIVQLIRGEGDQNYPITYSTDFQGKDASGEFYHLYCLEKNKTMPTDPDTYVRDQALTDKLVDAGITYIVTHAYPYDNTFMSDETVNIRKAVTQWAIWSYLNDTGKTLSDADKITDPDEIYALNRTDSKYAKIIRDLVTKAKTAKDESSDGLFVYPAWSEGYHITDDGKFLESIGYLFADGFGSELTSYKVQVNDGDIGVTFVDKNGVEYANGSTLPSSAQIRLRIPMEKLKNLGNNTINFSVTVTAYYSHKKVYAYKNENNPAAQTALIPEFYTTTSETKMEIPPIEIPTGKVKISKQDITTSKELAGATMVINDCNGEIVAKWVSSDKPYEIDALPVNESTCRYRLSELEAPKGYELSKEVIEFDVKNDGSVTELVYKNNPLTPTPDTGLNIPFTVYIAGGIILICGIAIIYASVKPKKEN